MTQPNAKCPTCKRVTATHALGCSVCECPNRRPEVWTPNDGVQGFAGTLAEDRIVRRRAERGLAIELDMEDL